MKYRFGLLISLLILAGCGSAERRSEPVDDQSTYRPTMDERRGEPVRLANSASTRQTASKPKQTGSAVKSLMAKAETQARSGQLTSAAATLERALRIEPRNPVLLSRLARTRLALGQHRRAINFATKSNSLAGGNYLLKRNNWKLIAKAKRAMGDAYGAQEAEYRAAAAGN